MLDYFGVVTSFNPLLVFDSFVPLVGSLGSLCGLLENSL